MNIFQLRYFVSVAQLENISKAADLLHLSQSSLSKSIAKLEAELGMPLFQRSGKHIVLNEQGRRFWEFSSMVLRELEFTIDDMNLLANGFGNKLKVGLCGANKIIMAVCSNLSPFIMNRADSHQQYRAIRKAGYQ